MKFVLQQYMLFRLRYDTLDIGLDTRYICVSVYCILVPYIFFCIFVLHILKCSASNYHCIFCHHQIQHKMPLNSLELKKIHLNKMFHTDTFLSVIPKRKSLYFMLRISNFVIYSLTPRKQAFLNIEKFSY